MTDIQPSSVTVLLRRMQSGDRAAFDVLMGLIYPELRRMAGAYFRGENRERVLQPTALVNEAYLRLVAHQDHNWQNRAHFFGATARLMHRILIERARARLADKRLGETISLDEGLHLAEEPSVELVLEEGLEELARTSPRQAQVVEMRFFGGLTFMPSRFRDPVRKFKSPSTEVHSRAGDGTVKRSSISDPMTY